MSTVRYNGSSASRLTPISTTLNNLVANAGTLAALVRFDSSTDGGVVGLVDSGYTDDYGSITTEMGTAAMYSAYVGDTGTSAGYVEFATAITRGSSADDFVILVLDWPTSGGGVVRGHVSGPLGSAESWQHTDAYGSLTNSSGPGTSGSLWMGFSNTGANMTGDIALIAAWAGTRLSDAQVEELWGSKLTSGWWNNSAGHPTALVELTSLTLNDIGAYPSTQGSDYGSPALTGLNPTGWTFDGRGEQTLTPDADLAAGGWLNELGTATPLYSKLNDSSDSTYITATAS